ncbi:oxygenase MpaB family protein [Streptomyces sp. CA-100214]
MGIHAEPRINKIVTEERMLGDARRWRRFGEPTPAGQSLKEDGTPDYGIFGPGSLTWEILLHPATVVFETCAQVSIQGLYMPIMAGVRDEDPMSRKAQAGTMTAFDAFDRLQRNSGLHAPMWFGDTPTAERMAHHLHRIHGHVTGDLIDVGAPELGGYAAAGPRESMWAAITELHPIMYLYENFAYHGDSGPRRLSDEQRDQYVAEMESYIRLVGGGPEEEFPKSMAELEALYEKYEYLFGKTETLDIIPKTGQRFREIVEASIQKNWDPSQQLARDQLNAVHSMDGNMLAALPEWFQIKAGLNEEQRAAAKQKLADSQDLIRELQQPENERRVVRLLWGPDAMTLIDNARELHQKALRDREALQS